MEFTTRLGLYSQTTRLWEMAMLVGSPPGTNGTLTLFGAPFQGTWSRGTPANTIPKATTRAGAGPARFSLG